MGNSYFKSIKEEEINLFFTQYRDTLTHKYSTHQLIDIKEYLSTLIDNHSYMLNIYIEDCDSSIVLKNSMGVQEYTQLRDIVELSEDAINYGVSFKLHDCLGCNKQCNYSGCISLESTA
jgi:hypothetical protein